MTKQNKAEPPQHDAYTANELDAPPELASGQLVPALMTLGRNVVGEFVTGLMNGARARRNADDGSTFDVPEKVEAEYRFTIPNTAIVAKLTVSMEVENWSDVLADYAEPVATFWPKSDGPSYTIH